MTSAGDGNHGTLTNMDSTTDYVAAKVNSQNCCTALDFDGVNDYVTIPHHSALDLGSKFTVMAWLKFFTTVQILALSKGLTSGVWWGIGTLNGRIDVQFDDGSVKMQINPSTRYDDGNWHHVTVVRDGGYELFVDGITKGTASDNGSLLNSQPFDIGRLNAGGGFYWNGQIDSPRIYNRPMSRQEVVNSYRLRPLGPFQYRTPGFAAIASSGGFNPAWAAQRQSKFIGGGVL